MLLAIDMGNTNITVGAYSQDALLFVTRLATERARTSDQYAVELLSILNLYDVNPSAFSGVIISSVVPELTICIANAAEKITNCRPMLLSPGLKTGMNILTDNPAQVGADLVAGAVGAAAKYPLPCLVVDLGTATKISIIDVNGSFCGCTISSGVAIALEALAQRTSQLPNISLTAPQSVIGKNTIDSMQAGTVFGAAAMIDGLCDRIEKELGENAETIVATGGLAQEIVKSCRHHVIYNGELILEGLKIIYQKNIKSK
jgi:type III pantothenate kinase